MNDAQLQRSVVRGRRLLITFFVAGLGIPFAFELWLPESWGDFKIPLGMFVALIVTVAVGVRENRRDERAAGLLPAKSGFSAEVEVLAEKLRDRATSIENDLRFGKFVESIDPTLLGVWQSVQTTARDRDHHELQSIDFNDPEAVRALASKLDVYVRDLRSRPSIHHMTPKEFRNGIIGMIVIGAAGAFMAYKLAGNYRGCGVIMLIGAVLMIALGIMAQREPA